MVFSLPRKLIIMIFKKKFIYIVYLLPIVFSAYLLWQNTKPVLELKYNLKIASAMVSELVPLARVGEVLKDKLGFYRIIKSEPVYIDVRLPRKYEKAEVEIEYFDLQNNIFEIGVSRDGAKKSFDFISLENKILDNLNWLRLERGGLVLYQRKLTYGSFEEFYNNPPSFEKTLIYRADAEPAVKNLKQNGATTIDFPVEKNIKMMVYHTGGKLNISVAANGNYKINVYDNSQAVLGDNFPKGFYKVEIIGDENTVFNKISINSRYVAILDSLNLGASSKPLKIYFAGSRLLAQTKTANGIQKMSIGKDNMDVQEAATQYKKDFDSKGIKNIIIPAGNIELGGTLFFLSDKNVFYPRYENLYSEFDLKNVDFILAKYAPPTESGGIKTAKAVFYLKNTDFSNGKIRFLLSLPNAATGDLVKIRGIKIKFVGERFTLKKIYFKLVSYLAN